MGRYKMTLYKYVVTLRIPGSDTPRTFEAEARSSDEAISMARKLSGHRNALCINVLYKGVRYDRMR